MATWTTMEMTKYDYHLCSYDYIDKTKCFVKHLMFLIQLYDDHLRYEFNGHSK